jgi:hypothetical protein
VLNNLQLVQLVSNTPQLNQTKLPQLPNHLVANKKALIPFNKRNTMSDGLDV